MSDNLFERLHDLSIGTGSRTPLAAIERIKELEQRLNDITADKINLRSENMELEAKLSESEALLAKAVKALEFYADPSFDGYEICITDYGMSMETGCIIKDDGDKARTTLAKLKGETK